MLSTPPAADPLGALQNAEIPSEVSPGVSYRIVAKVGEGSMAMAFFALRVGPEGECPVVVKVVRPEFARQLGPTAALIVRKEAIALGRLNERIPPTPFVVRFIDTGSVAIRLGDEPLELPWIAVEYVHGGTEGTTLTERVTHSLRRTGYAFDLARAARAVRGLSAGLGAVHEMGVIHRDLKPDNVLCCGFGAGEILKIADFGVARPMGMQATFGGLLVGTLGYSAPELTTQDARAIGPWSDVFSLASVLFYLLTGEDYFTVETPAEILLAAIDPRRRSIREARGLSPDIRARELACRAIDFALATATSARTDARPQTAEALCSLLLPWLTADPADAVYTRTVTRLELVAEDEDAPTDLGSWTWTTLQKPGTGRVIRSVAWDGDGRCLAATSAGLSFWDGTSWREASLEKLPNPEGVRFVRRVAAGRWIVGGDDATFATYTPEGVTEVSRLGQRGARYELLSGDLDDLAVLVGKAPGAPPTLCALSSRRWLKPLPLPEVAALMSIARVDDASWLLAGRGTDGNGFAALYMPLDWEVQRLATPAVRAFLACAGQWECGVGVATGAQGAIVWAQDGVSSNGGAGGSGPTVSNERVDEAVDLSAAGVDVVGRGWAAGAGRIWLRRIVQQGTGALAGRWDCIWRDDSWSAPIVSLFPDLGAVIAMTADGGIVEGRAALSNRTP